MAIDSNKAPLFVKNELRGFVFIAAAPKNGRKSYNRIDVREFPKNLISTKKIVKLYDRPRLPLKNS